MQSKSQVSKDFKRLPLWSRIPVKVPLAILTGAILLVAVGSFLLFKNEEKKIVQENYSNLHYIAQFKVQQITQWRNERISDTIFFSSSPLFQESLETWSKNQNNNPLPQALIDRMRLVRSIYGYEAALIVAENGTLIYPDSSQAPALSPETLRLLRESKSSGSAQMGDFFFSQSAQKIVIEFAAPIESLAGTALGYLVLQVDPQTFLYPMIQAWPTNSESAETLLIRRDGDSVLYLNALRHSDANPLTLSLPITEVNVPAIQVVTGQSGPLRGHDYRAVEVYAQALPVPNTSWYMISKVDVREVRRESIRMLIGLLAIDGFAALIAILVAAYFVSFRQKSLLQKLLYVEREAQMDRNLLSETLSASLDEIYLFDATNYRFRFVNEGAIKNLGYTRDQLLYMTPLDIKPLLGERDFARLLLPLEDGKQSIAIFETVHQRSDHSQYPVEVHIQLFNYGGDRVYLAVIQDITERTLAAERIKESYEKYRPLFQSFPLGLMVTGSEQILIEVNPEVERILAIPAASILGHTYPDNNWKFIRPNGEPMPVEEMASSQAIAESRWVQNVEMGFVRNGGDTVWLRVSAVPLHIKEDGLLIILEDITSQVQIKKELLHSQERYRYLVEYSPDALFVNRDSRIEFINPAGVELFGAKSAEEILGMNPYKIFHPDYHDHMHERIKQMVEDKLPVPLIHEQIIRLDGAIRDVEVAATPFTDEKGMAIQVILRDVTERKLAEERLQAQLLELRRWQEATLGREMRILELKREVNNCLRESGFSERYLQDDLESANTPAQKSARDE